MKQETFTDIEYSCRKKKTKREEFLEIMDEIIPWDEWVDVIKPYYSAGKRGRPPMGIEKMLRMYLLQIWFNLSDPATEDAIYDSYAMRKFTGIDFMTEAVPDETTLSKFRHLLEANGLNKLFFEAINRVMVATGHMMKVGTIVDATIINAPSSTKNADKARDPEMHQTKKGNEWKFGMKCHIGVDAGSEKWVDFVAEFWHCECIREHSEKVFMTKYQRWCKKHGYNFCEEKARSIFNEVCGCVGVMPKSSTAKLLVEQAVSQLKATSSALAALKQEMQELAAQLPEYPIVMGMFGVGPTLGPQLMAEIGDVRRFYSKKAIVAYAGIDAPPNDSGDVTGRHKSMSKVGASSPRRTLFLVISVYLQNSPSDEPIYQFMDRKRSEGKPYRVYMMASANKFLRIYYASVKAYLDKLEQI